MPRSTKTWRLRGGIAALVLLLGLQNGTLGQNYIPPTGGNGGGSGTINAGLINQLAYYAAGGTTLSGLATCNSGVIITSAGGVPSCGSTLPSGLTIPGFASSTATLTLGSTTLTLGGTTTTVAGLTLTAPVLGVATGTGLALAPAANTLALSIAGASHTGTDATSDLNLATTLNTSGAQDVVAVKATCTSCANVKLLNLYGGASGTTTEFSVDRIGNLALAGSITGSIYTSNDHFTFNSTGNFGWTSGNTAASVDTNLSRDAAGIVDVGTGAQGSAAGSMKMTNLTASGTITFAGVTTGTNADFACFAAGGVMTLQTTACTVSSMRFKDMRSDLVPTIYDMLADTRRLQLATYTMKSGEKPNPDPNYASLQDGLTAENVAKVMPRCAVYENDMKTPKSYRQECVIAHLVGAVQALAIR